MGKTVIFGGTFNPIHLAHIEMIEEVAKLSFVDKVLVVPTRIPPHKNTDNDFLDGNTRLSMCKIATKHIEKVECSDIELKLKDKSYTVNTIDALKRENPQTEYALLIGGDMLASFTEWYKFEEILNEVSIICVNRNTVDRNEFLNYVENLKNMGADIFQLNIKTPPISSSLVRQRIKQSEDVKQYLTKDVINYITKNNLYRGNNIE